jgi:hypothetical protein
MKNRCVVIDCKLGFQLGERTTGWLALALDGEDTSGAGFHQEGLICPLHAYYLGALFGGDPVGLNSPLVTDFEPVRDAPAERSRRSSRDKWTSASRMVASRVSVIPRPQRAARKRGRSQTGVTRKQRARRRV